MSVESFRQVLLVDDEPEFLFSARMTLRAAGIEPVHTIADSRNVLPFLSGRDAAVLVLDLEMPHLTGVELLPRVRERHPEIPVIILTGAEGVETAVGCMKAGAFDYLVKPVESARFILSVRQALNASRRRDEPSSPDALLVSPPDEGADIFHGIASRNRQMHAIFRYVEAVASSRHPVLITGETGVGKELIARAIHALSGCRGEFVAVNVAGLDDTMFSDTLFGHRKGAYTGAHQNREGLLAKAAGGTIFLDEIGDLEMRTQVKLLRLLDQGAYYPLGSDVPLRSDARVLCATHHCLAGRMLARDFRNDLFYRLHTHHVAVPPLRDRMDDLPLLLEQCLDDAARSLRKRKPTPPRELFTLLSVYRFPGNVRELRAMVLDAVAQHRSGVLSLERFRRAIEGSRSGRQGGEVGHPADEAPFPLADRFPTLREASDFLVAEALRRSGNNRGTAALLLGITREALKKRLARRKSRTRADKKPDPDAKG